MRPFESVKVLDLTQSIAGPFATQMLGSMGAEVVKVEPPGGDAFRDLLEGAMFYSVNLGDKRSICVDLKEEEGREAVQALADEADVIIESFRPGVIDKFGLDYESVSATNEEVIYVSLSGYGQDGPYSQWPGYDPIVQAISGLMSMIGYQDRPPVRIGASVIDCGAGTNAAYLIASGLIQREKTGEGEYIDLSLFEVAVTWIHYWITYYSITGDVPQRAGQGFGGFAPSKVFEAGDGGEFYMSIVNDAFFARLCRAIDRKDLIDDERFEHNEDRLSNREALRAELVPEFEKYERSELIDRLTAEGVPAGPLQDIGEVVDEDEHVAARGMLTEVYNETMGTEAKVPELPFMTSEGRQHLTGSPPPLGGSTREVLSEIGYSDSEIDDLIDRGVFK